MIPKVNVSALAIGLRVQVIGVPDCSSIYRVPVLLEEAHVLSFVLQHLHLSMSTPRPRKFLNKWKELADRSEAYN